ncbi:MAG: outer membrane protein/peptidoglycan-associated protein [Bryobacterales bacterium]|jgi:outer membrane protein OmpA-like peptidoglycan-associated protein|nr:outer membrane protein/peptidoglycan-associated protein [Bryobacterales bacterium]
MTDYGVLQPLAENAGVIVNVGLAIAGLLFGKAGFDPPVVARKAIVRVLSVLCGVIAALLWKFGRGQLDTLTFERIAAWGAIALLLTLVAYVIAFSALSLTCDDDPNTRYLGGFRLRPQARAVLAGDRNQPQPYGPLPVTPTDTKSYFCNSGRRPEFLWPLWSIRAAEILMVLLFAALLISGSIALSASAMVLLGPDVKVETRAKETRVELPADVLFAFDRFDLLPAATRELVRAATILRLRSVRSATIEGHTDAVGKPDYNQRLSTRRAEAVYNWLKEYGEVDGIDLHVVGYGATRPRAPNQEADGSDNPEGRARNRRVEIVFEAR